MHRLHRNQSAKSGAVMQEKAAFLSLCEEGVDKSKSIVNKF
ncbi:hypothetical protein [Rubritalea tangerina]